MKIFSKSFFVLPVLLFYSCNASKNALEKTLSSQNENIQRVIKNPDNYEVQILYTQVIRKKGKISFKDFNYHLNADNYFYPASTIKMPIAILALEKLNTYPETSYNAIYSIEGQEGKLKFADEITKVFAVSDNTASSNLFEFVGFDYMNKTMKEKGLKPFRISHRLSGSDPANPMIKRVTLYKDDGSEIIIPSQLNEKASPLNLHKLKKGIGYMKNNIRIDEPFDFAMKNYFPLETMHNTIKRIVFPEAFAPSERFNLTDKDREFILFSMQNLPRNAGYDAKEYYDSYCKFLMFGDSKNEIPSTIKIYNKIGQAYGTLTDSAYIVDKENNVEFILSATILVNKDGIFNDNVYEYETVGLPFLAELGRQIYEQSKTKSN